jgi:F-type H+-transporting ATPase subunit delta
MTDSAKHQDMDIDRQRLGATYAKALLGASGSDNTDQVVEELESLVADVLDKIPGVGDLMSSLRIDAAEKSQMIDRLFGGRCSDGLIKFLKVLNRHGRLDCIRHVAKAARKGINQKHGRIAVNVTTAEPIDGDVTNRIADVLRGRLQSEVDVSCSVDSRIIGGLVVKVGDKVFDGSVANKLARLRTDAIGQTVRQLRGSLDRFAEDG